MIEFAEYIRKVFLFMEGNTTRRAGQAYFNVLHEIRPDLADDITGTDLDPYYDDLHLPAFLTWLCSVMSDSQS